MERKVRTIELGVPVVDKDGLRQTRLLAPMIGKDGGCYYWSLIRMLTISIQPIAHSPRRETKTCLRIASVPQMRRMTCSFFSFITWST